MKKTPAIGKDDAKKKEKANYLDLPTDYEDPKIDVGETFEAVAEIRRDKDGYCVVSLDGVPTDAEKEKRDAMGERDDDEDDTQSIGAGARKAAQPQDY